MIGVSAGWVRIEECHLLGTFPVDANIEAALLHCQVVEAILNGLPQLPSHFSTGATERHTLPYVFLFDSRQFRLPIRSSI